MDAQAVIDAADLAADFGEEALSESNRRVHNAALAGGFDEAVRWRDARHFLVQHSVIDQLMEAARHRFGRPTEAQRLEIARRQRMASAVGDADASHQGGMRAQGGAADFGKPKNFGLPE